MVKLSLVVPCYNEGENVIPFHEAALNAFQDCGYEIEIVYIDDGSRDATLHNLKKVYARKDCRVKSYPSPGISARKPASMQACSTPPANTSASSMRICSSGRRSFGIW